MVALEGQDLPRMYLAHHEPENIVNIDFIVLIINYH